MYKLTLFSEQKEINEDLEQHWNAYLQATKNNANPRKILMKAVDHMNQSHQVEDKEKFAIDIGCGSSGCNTLYLLSRGYQVLAIDQPKAITMMLRNIPNQYKNQVAIYSGDIRNIKELPQADVISCSYVLPFIPPEQFFQVINIIKASIKAGGCLAIDFFGYDDSWANDPRNRDKMTFHTNRDIQEMFPSSEFMFAHYHEKNQTGNTAAGQQKVWHVFHSLMIKNVMPEKESKCLQHSSSVKKLKNI